LAEAVLTVAGSSLNLEAVASLILDESQFACQSMNKRLALLVEKLNEMHYQARWEAGAGGPRVLFGRCPYARVIDAHPEICTMDAALLKNVLARDISQTKKNETPIKGMCPFIFQIG
jgi:predicted ArsR family transcriptional regulator